VFESKSKCGCRELRDGDDKESDGEEERMEAMWVVLYLEARVK
jgi:hypothetical protein